MITSQTSRHKPGKFPAFDWQAPRTVGEFGTRPFAGDLAINTVYDPRVVDVMAYNFHPSIFQDRTGRCHLIHTTHDREEEGPGSWCRWWTSDDRGTTWIERGEIAPALAPYSLTHNSTRRLAKPVRIMEIDGQVYSVYDVNQNGGFNRVQIGIMVVEMTGNSFGEPYYVFPDAVVPLAGFPTYPTRADKAGIILRELQHPYSVSWTWGIGSLFPPNPDGAGWGVMNEYQKLRVGRHSIVLARSTAGTTNRKWMSASEDGVAFSDWQVTGIPYGTTRTCWKKFSDRYIMLINTDSPSRWQCMAAYSADGLKYVSANTERIRPHTISSTIEIDDFNDVNTMPTQPLFPGTAKAGATSYFDVCELDNGQYLAAMGERGKEVIRTARWTPMALT